MEHVEAFPLQWPEGWARTPAPKRRYSTFKTSLAIARDDLLEEIRRLGGRDPIISTNIATYTRRGQQIPYANQGEPDDPGVAVYWTLKGEQRVIACDRWKTVRENIRAIGLTISALRSLDRWGSSAMLDRVFTGFAALPESVRERPWWLVIGVEPDWTLEEIEQVYRNTSKLLHPDRGGDPERMAELNRAIAEARAEDALRHGRGDQERE